MKKKRVELQRLFTLEEATAQLSWIQETLRVAQTELNNLYDTIVLHKRMYAIEYAERSPRETELEQLLEGKIHAFESSVEKWVQRFADQGVLLRDIQKGICNFPYKDAYGDMYFLLWQQGDSGILYFHEAEESPIARKPITLLPN
ncbi:MAG: DUF2203 family protein [Vampirovibrionales bacterium]